LVPLFKTYDGAVKKCQSYGMSLYNVDAPADRKALFDFSNSRYTISIEDILSVEGKTSEGCAAVAANSEGLFEIFQVDCSIAYYFYCQFTRTPKTDEPGNHS
jgi:hypothetical protein